MMQSDLLSVSLFKKSVVEYLPDYISVDNDVVLKTMQRALANNYNIYDSAIILSQELAQNKVSIKDVLDVFLTDLADFYVQNPSLKDPIIEQLLKLNHSVFLSKISDASDLQAAIQRSERKRLKELLLAHEEQQEEEDIRAAFQRIERKENKKQLQELEEAENEKTNSRNNATSSPSGKTKKNKMAIFLVLFILIIAAGIGVYVANENGNSKNSSSDAQDRDEASSESAPVEGAPVYEEPVYEEPISDTAIFGGVGEAVTATPEANSDPDRFWCEGDHKYIPIGWVNDGYCDCPTNCEDDPDSAE